MVPSLGMDRRGSEQRFSGDDGEFAKRVREAKRMGELRVSMKGYHELPNELRGLVQGNQLRVLELEGHRLKAEEFDTLPETLEELNVSANLLGRVPTGVYYQAFGSLRSLRIARNRIKELPGLLSQCRALESLDVSGNDLTALPEELGTLPRLKELRAHSNPLASFPRQLCRLSGLTELDLSHCDLTALPSEIGCLRQLQRLNAHHNGITALPPSIGKLVRLVELHVNDCNLVALPLELSQCSELAALSTGCNPLVFPPASICMQGPGSVRFFLHSAWRKVREGGSPVGEEGGSATSCAACAERGKEVAELRERAERSERLAERHMQAAIKKDKELDKLRKSWESSNEELHSKQREMEAVNASRANAERETHQMKARAETAERQLVEMSEEKDWLSRRSNVAESELDRVRSFRDSAEREASTLRASEEAAASRAAAAEKEASRLRGTEEACAALAARVRLLEERNAQLEHASPPITRSEAGVQCDDTATRGEPQPWKAGLDSARCSSNFSDTGGGCEALDVEKGRETHEEGGGEEEEAAAAIVTQEEAEGPEGGDDGGIRIYGEDRLKRVSLTGERFAAEWQLVDGAPKVLDRERLDPF